MSIPLIDPGSGTGATGITRLAYRKRLGRMLGPYFEGTVSAEAAGLEAERYVISDSVGSDDIPPEHWDGLYLYVRDGAQAGEQRKLQRGAADNPLGALVMDAPFDDALVAGTAFEISVLPAESYLGATGQHSALDEALESLPVLDFVSVTAVTDQSEYDFTGYPWPIKSISSVVYPRTSTTNERRRSLHSGAWNLVQDTSSTVLSFIGGVPFTAGDVFEVGLLRPANTWIKTAGVWASSSGGLTTDEDSALYDVRTVCNAAYPVALDYLAMVTTDPKERQRLDQRAAEGHDLASISKWFGRFGSGPKAQRVGATGGGRGGRFWDRL